MKLGRLIDKQVKGESFKVIFSAHSVPLLALDFEDPYIDQIVDNAQMITGAGLSSFEYTNTWQSRESDIEPSLDQTRCIRISSLIRLSI